MIRLISAGITDIGLGRANNEDAWGEVLDKQFYVIADGMGGHRAGEVASQKTVEKLCSDIQNVDMEDKDVEELQEILLEAIIQVNAEIHAMGDADVQLQRMGITVCCLWMHKDTVIFAHVGDSRIYCLHQGLLEQMTEDHSLLAKGVAEGRFDEIEAARFMFKNVITQAIGTNETVKPSSATVPLKGGDLYMLCTDGLTDALPAKSIQSILEQGTRPIELAQNLIEAAKDAGSRDNVSVVIIKAEEEK